MRRLAQLVGATPWWLWLIAAIALVLRLAPLLYGLPYELNADERYFVTAAWEMIEGGKWDPDWYGHPAAPLHGVVAALFWVYSAIGTQLGVYGSVADAGAAYYDDVTHFFVIGRIVTAISGTAVVVATYALARQLRVGRWWAAVAALMVTFSWPIIEMSSQMRADMSLSLGFLLIAWLALRAVANPRGRTFIVAGVVLGLTVTSKYPGVLTAIPIVLAARAVVSDGRVHGRQATRWLLAAGLSALVTAFVVAPYLFVNPLGTLYWVLVEVGSQHVGATGGGPIDHLAHYLTKALPTAIGAPGAVLGIAGLALLSRRRATAFIPFSCMAYLVFISILSHWWARWLLPLLPFAAVGAGVVLTATEARLRAPSRSRLAGIARAGVAAVLVLPIVVPTLPQLSARLSSDDTRAFATRWIEEQVPPDSVLLVDSNTVHPRIGELNVLVAHEGEIVEWSEVSRKSRPDGYFGRLGDQLLPLSPEVVLDEIDRRGVDYVVVSEGWFAAIANSGPEYQEEADMYTAILEAFPVVATFGREDAALGPPVVVLARE